MGSLRERRRRRGGIRVGPGQPSAQVCVIGVKGPNIVDLWTMTPGGCLRENNGGMLVEGPEGPQSAASGSVTQRGVLPLQYPCWVLIISCLGDGIDVDEGDGALQGAP
jgi:hypothetical protein